RSPRGPREPSRPLTLSHSVTPRSQRRSSPADERAYDERTNSMKLRKTVSAAAAATAIAISAPHLGQASGGHTLFLRSAVENANGTATIPLYLGTSGGQTVYYVMTDSSDGNFSRQFGLNRSQDR